MEIDKAVLDMIHEELRLLGLLRVGLIKHGSAEHQYHQHLKRLLYQHYPVEWSTFYVERIRKLGATIE